MSGTSSGALRIDPGLLSKAEQAPLLTAQEEVDLVIAYLNGDDRAGDRLVRSHLRLIIRIAADHKGFGHDINEVIQVGCIGMLTSLRRFEPSKGRLSTFAEYRIRAAVQNFVMRDWSHVRIGTTEAQRKLFFSLRRERKAIGANPDAPLDDVQAAEVAERVGVAARDVREMDQRLSGRDESLNVPVRESGQDRIYLLKDHSPSQEQRLEYREDRDMRRNLLRIGLGRLSDRERDIINRRRLKEDQDSLNDLSADYGVSMERIRQIEQKALVKLKAFFEEQCPDGAAPALVPRLQTV